MKLARRTGTGLACAVAALALASPAQRAGASATVTAGDGAVGVQLYHPPGSGQGAASAGGPSISANHATGSTMYVSGASTFKVAFDDTATPASATWSDVSEPATPAPFQDHVLFTDSALNRTVSARVTGTSAAIALTTNDGATWTPSRASPPSDARHQSIAAGPYSSSAASPPSAAFSDAVYYCSEAMSTSFCTRSDDGGLTFGPEVSVSSPAQCGDLHGHVRVSPGGLVMLPNAGCDAQADLSPPVIFPSQALLTSSDNGVTWRVQTIPGSRGTLRSAPSVTADKANQVYVAYENAAYDKGGNQVGGRATAVSGTLTGDGSIAWSAPVDVGAASGVRNVQAPVVVAGDAGRVAFAFLGSTAPGNPEDPSFIGTWDLYLAITQDGGQTWVVSDTTPDQPVERGCTDLSGTVGACPAAKHNLGDGIDMTVDANGRVEVAYTDGCTGACQQNDGLDCQGSASGYPQACDTGSAASIASEATIARVGCGPSLDVADEYSFLCPQAAAGAAQSLWLPGLAVAAGAALIAWTVVRRRRPFPGRKPGPRARRTQGSGPAARLTP